MYSQLENIKPLRNRVLIKLFALPKEVKVNGIVRLIDVSIEKKFRLGRVLAIGDDVMCLNRCDKILVNRQFGLKINNAKYDEDDFRIVSCDQIEGTVDESLDSDEFWLNL